MQPNFIGNLSWIQKTKTKTKMFINPKYKYTVLTSIKHINHTLITIVPIFGSTVVLWKGIQGKDYVLTSLETQCLKLTYTIKFITNEKLFTVRKLRDTLLIPRISPLYIYLQNPSNKIHPTKHS